MLHRREFLRYGLAAGAALAAPVAYGTRAVRAEAATAPAHSGHTGPVLASNVKSLVVPAFQHPLPMPPVLTPSRSRSGTDVYHLTTREVTTELVPGLPTKVYSYGSAFVGPTIRAVTGRPTVVVHRNRLGMGTAAHLHGGHVPAGSDGHPMDLVDPGEQRAYFYPNRQTGATLWYHDHAHHMEAEHVYRGLAGFYLLRDPHEDRLPLPAGRFDVPIMLRDAWLGDDGTLLFEHGDLVNRTTILANGRVQPYLRVAARKYRLRFLNAANLRIFGLKLAGGDPAVQIAGDGGLLPAPISTPMLTMFPGERAEVVVDFSRYPVGSQIVLENAYGESEATRTVMRFDVVRAAEDPSSVPDRLRELPALGTADVARDVSLGFDPAQNRMVISGKPFDPDRVDATIRRGSTEIWRITNLDTQPFIPHNLHLHLVQFRVLDRNGRPPQLPGETGLKDTVTVMPGETVRIQATFGDHLGRFVYHCHLLDHSAEGMMAQMEIVR